jgi:hypothetical protein
LELLVRGTGFFEEEHLAELDAEGLFEPAGPGVAALSFIGTILTRRVGRQVLRVRPNSRGATAR